MQLHFFFFTCIMVFGKIPKIDLWMYNLNSDLIRLRGLRASAAHCSNDVLTDIDKRIKNPKKNRKTPLLIPQREIKAS